MDDGLFNFFYDRDIPQTMEKATSLNKKIKECYYDTAMCDRDSPLDDRILHLPPGCKFR